MYEKFKNISVLQDVDKTLTKIANNLEAKLVESINILEKSRDVILNGSLENLRSAITPCDKKEPYDETENFNNIVTNKSFISTPLSINYGNIFRKN